MRNRDLHLQSLYDADSAQFWPEVHIVKAQAPFGGECLVMQHVRELE